MGFMEFIFLAVLGVFVMFLLVVVSVFLEMPRSCWKPDAKPGHDEPPSP